MKERGERREKKKTMNILADTARQLQIPKADRQAKRQPYYTHGRKRHGAAGSKRVASAFGD
jgi:hypothetical protein